MKNTNQKQWVKPTVQVAQMSEAEAHPLTGRADGLGQTGIGMYYS